MYSIQKISLKSESLYKSMWCSQRQSIKTYEIRSMISICIAWKIWIKQNSIQKTSLKMAGKFACMIASTQQPKEWPFGCQQARPLIIILRTHCSENITKIIINKSYLFFESYQFPTLFVFKINSVILEKEDNQIKKIWGQLNLMLASKSATLLSLRWTLVQ